VRWAAVRGAKIVFHPHHTGSDQTGVRLTQWGSTDAPYYEKADDECAVSRTRFYFASVNYGLRFQESATTLIAPSGQVQAYLPYGQEGVLVQAIKVEEATGLLANRYAPSAIANTDPTDPRCRPTSPSGAFVGRPGTSPPDARPGSVGRAPPPS